VTPAEAWLDCVKRDTKNFGLSQRDAQDRDQWRIIINLGKLANPGQARREPQRGPGKHYRRALSPHSVCLEIEMPKASRGRKRGEGCALTIRLWVWGSVVSSPSGVRGRAPTANRFYAYISSKRSHLEHHFQYFRATAGPPKRHGARENFPPLPPLDGPDPGLPGMWLIKWGM